MIVATQDILHFNLGNMKSILLNAQQMEFILDECKDIREGNNYSQYAKTVASQLYEKIMIAIEEDYENNTN